MILAVKDSWRLLPTADALYACDEHWWTLYADEIKRSSRAALWTQCERSARKFALNRWPGESRPGLGRRVIHFGGNSGYQAINLAFLLGASRILLSGFDMQRTDGKAHFFGDHPYQRNGKGTNSALLADWCVKFRQLAHDLEAEGVEVINATRQTALDCFPRLSLESVA